MAKNGVKPMDSRVPRNFEKSNEETKTKNKKILKYGIISIIGLFFILAVAASALGGGTSTDTSTTYTPPEETTPEPTAESAPETTNTDAAYESDLDGWIAEMTTVSQNIGEIAGSAADSQITFTEAGSMFRTEKSTVDSVVSDMESTTPPAKYTEFHSVFLSSCKDVQTALMYNIRGCENYSVEDIETATSYLDSSTRKVSEATDILERIS